MSLDVIMIYFIMLFRPFVNVYSFFQYFQFLLRSLYVRVIGLFRIKSIIWLQGFSPTIAEWNNTFEAIDLQNPLSVPSSFVSNMNLD